MTSASKASDSKATALELPLGTLVVGDLHLDVEDAGDLARFVDWLEQLQVPRLVILGDLFEYWIGDRALESEGARVAVNALARFVRERGPIDLVPGNRDFLLGQRFEQASGVRLAPDGFVALAANGERVLLVHGDELVTSDVSYQRYRRIVRKPWIRRWAGRLPTSVSNGIAQRLRRVSKREVARKEMSATDVVLSDCDLTAQAAHADVLICGHVHRQRSVQLASGARLLIVDALGDGTWDAVRLGQTINLQPSGIARRNGERHSAGTMIVAMDGPAGAGKSTVARRVAAALGLAFLDTGAMYRAVTLVVLERGVHPNDHEACEEVARSLHLSFDEQGSILIDGVPGEPSIRSQTVTLNVSAVSAHAGVREAIVGEQRQLAQRLKGVVAEGRDTATVVFPKADHKFFLDASPAERARRRAKQDGALDRVTEIQADIARRDKLDTTRAHSPLRQASDAQLINGDGLDVDEVVALILTAIRERSTR